MDLPAPKLYGRHQFENAGVADVLGPLGNPTPIAVHGAVACVGGGVGTAELLPIARALHAEFALERLGPVRHHIAGGH